MCPKLFILENEVSTNGVDDSLLRTSVGPQKMGQIRASLAKSSAGSDFLCAEQVFVKESFAKVKEN